MSSSPVLPDGLVPAELLQKPGKILFIAHLALGDYTYLQNCFVAFARAFPHLRIHLWVDEVRRSKRPQDWPHLQRYALYDWVRACPIFERVYDQTYSPYLYHASIAEAQAENYPIVISLAVLRRHLYAELARRISPKGFVIGQKKRVRLLDIRKHIAYARLDGTIPAYRQGDPAQEHISAIYAGWFKTFSGIEIPESERFPFVDIPLNWKDNARDTLALWGYDEADPTQRPLVFINTFSKSTERNWPLERALELMQLMHATPRWRHARYIVNAVPEELERAKAVLGEGNGPGPVYRLFSATENFFQLPAMLAHCDMIISVETAVMHLANAVHVPVVALMRQNNPEWAPIDRANSVVITVERRNGWVKEIPAAPVLEALDRLEAQRSGGGVATAKSASGRNG